MVIKLQDLITKVRIKLNENPKDEGFTSGVGHNGLTLDQIIASITDEEIRRITELSIFTGFDDLQKLYGPITVRNGAGRFELPADFHRLVEIKVSGWKRAATELTGPENPDYWRRTSISRIVRGTEENPRVYAVEDGTSRYLELHPCSEGAEIEYGDYVSNPMMTPVGSFYLPDRMVPEATSAIAARVREILRV